MTHQVWPSINFKIQRSFSVTYIQLWWRLQKVKQNSGNGQIWIQTHGISKVQCLPVYSFQSLTDRVGLTLQHNHQLVKHGHERSFNKHLTWYSQADELDLFCHSYSKSGRLMGHNLIFGRLRLHRVRKQTATFEPIFLESMEAHAQ